MIDRYQDRKNAENMAAQHPAVQDAAREILVTLGDIEKFVYWAVDGEDPVDHWGPLLIETTHKLVDLAHEYRQTLKDNPSPQQKDDEPLDEDRA